MPAERTKSWSYQDPDMYSTQMVWQAPVASFIEPAPKIVELDDDDLPPLVDAPPLSSYPPPPATFTFVSSGDDFTNDDAPAPRKRAASHGKKRPENHIPRPPNAFILFRSSFIKAQHVSTSIETNHSTLSKIIGLTWKNLSEDERKHWHEEAKKELEKHKKRFPKYAFKPQQTKGKGSGAKGAGDSGGGTGKRKVREVEPKDEKRCAKIAELLVQGVKGNELNAKMEEFDRTHVPEIVTRFEAPITESHFQVDEQSFRRGSSAPIEETELKIEQASFLPKAKAPKKVRRSISERPTRASTPQTQNSVASLPVHLEQPQAELQQPAFDFTNFSFDAAAPSMATPYAASVDPTSSYPVAQQSFPNDLSIDTSFMQMQDWSACSSPVSPSPSFSMPSTPDFEAQSPSPAFVSSPSSPAPTFTAQMNMFSLNEKSFNDYNQYNVTMPTYQQGIDGFGADAYLGVDSYGFDAGMNMDAYNPSGYAAFDAVPQYTF